MLLVMLISATLSDKLIYKMEPHTFFTWKSFDHLRFKYRTNHHSICEHVCHFLTRIHSSSLRKSMLSTKTCRIWNFLIQWIRDAWMNQITKIIFRKQKYHGAPPWETEVHYDFSLYIWIKKNKDLANQKYYRFPSIWIQASCDLGVDAGKGSRFPSNFSTT